MVDASYNMLSKLYVKTLLKITYQCLRKKRFQLTLNVKKQERPLRFLVMFEEISKHANFSNSRRKINSAPSSTSLLRSFCVLKQRLSKLSKYNHFFLSGKFIRLISFELLRHFLF